MHEISAELIRKNNISAYWFLATAILCALVLAFFVFAFFMIFVSISALFSGLDDKAVSSDLGLLYLAFFLSILAIVSQFVAFGLIKFRSRYGRIAGIISFVSTVLFFTPLSLLLIYPFAFLMSDNGKYVYQQLNKN